MRRTTRYVLCFIELGTRRVQLAGVSDHPHGPWVVQRARQRSLERPQDRPTRRLLLRDRDSTFTRTVDDVVASDGTQSITTPIQAPTANAYAERWVRTVREECLDWLLVWGRCHLERVLGEYVRHDNDERPHRGLAPRPPTVVDDDFDPGAVTAALMSDAGTAWVVPFTSITTPQHDVRVSEPLRADGRLDKRSPPVLRLLDQLGLGSAGMLNFVRWNGMAALVG